MRALLVINKGSRRGRARIDGAINVLREGGIELIERRPRDPQAIDRVIREHGDEADLIIVGGGDGTLNAAAEAVLAVGRPLGILPLGTANDLVRSLEIPTSPQAAAQVILAGRRRRVDLGRANSKLFFNIATLGLSVKLARAMRPAEKRHFGALAYALALTRIGIGRPFDAVIRTGGTDHRVRAIQIAVGNGRFHGGGVVVHEDAAIDDGLLHLYALPPQSGWRLLRQLPWLLRGRHKDLDGVTTFAAASVEITTDRRLKINTDGEITSTTPARFDVLPGALEILVP